MFLFGAILLIIGMGFFTLGADMAMIPMGGPVNVSLLAIVIRPQYYYIGKSKKIPLKIR